MENTKKRRNHVVSWLFCSIVVVISIFYLFPPENIISGQIEVTASSSHKSAKALRKRLVAIKAKVIRKISKNKTVETSKILSNKTVEPSKISNNKTVEPSKISNNKTVLPSKISKNKTIELSKISKDITAEPSKNKTVEPSKISKNKRVKPSDDSEYQSEYVHI